MISLRSDAASDVSLSDVEATSGDAENVSITGIVASPSANTVNSNETLWVVLSVVGVVLLTLTLVLIFSKKARYKVGRFFSELFAGIFGKKKV